MLSLGDRLVERNGTVENVCRKYLLLKKRKDEQEILLRGSIETLQVQIRSVASSRLHNAIPAMIATKVSRAS